MQELIKHFVLVFSLTMLRYIVFAGIAYFIFYVWKREAFILSKIQSRFPKREEMVREIYYSVGSLSIFALAGCLLFYLRSHGHTLIYLDIAAHSGWYFLFSVVVFIIAHDTYFYWTHRFMHWDAIYKYVHRVHHLSTNPTPWAAFAFHPFEAVIEVSILFVMVFVLPLHPLAIFAWVLYMTSLNVLGHLGFELFPAGFTSNAITRWHNTSTHHNMHHRLVKCNYGLYFNIWDRIMGTNHEQYHEEFEKVKARSAVQEEAINVNKLSS